MNIIAIVGAFILGFGIAGFCFGRIIKKKNSQIGRSVNLADKHMELYMLMNQWVKNYQQGKRVENFFAKRNIKTIAIYGMNYVGQTLYDELKNTSVTPVYGIDRNYKKIYSEIEIVSPDDELKEVDAIVVTSITFFEDIRQKISDKTNAEIINLFDVVFNL